MSLFSVQHMQWKPFGQRANLTNVVGDMPLVERQLGPRIRPSRFEFILFTPKGSSEVEIRADKVVIVLDSTGQAAQITSLDEMPANLHVGCLRHRNLLYLHPMSMFWPRVSIFFAAADFDNLFDYLLKRSLSGDAVDIQYPATAQAAAPAYHFYCFVHKV